MDGRILLVDPKKSVLVSHKCLWTGEDIEQKLIDPNQMRHFLTDVQDDPTFESLAPIENVSFSLTMKIIGAIVRVSTQTLSKQ